MHEASRWAAVRESLADVSTNRAVTKPVHALSFLVAQWTAPRDPVMQAQKQFLLAWRQVCFRA
jgi:hypothetical protein